MSQSFVVEITNPGRRATRKDVVKYLQDVHVSYKSCRKASTVDPAIVTFNNEEEMKNAIKYLSLRKNKSGDLLVVEERDPKNFRPDTISDVVTPLWESEYSTQLELKQREMVHALRRLIRNLRRAELREGKDKYGLYKWLQVQRGGETTRSSDVESETVKSSENSQNGMEAKEDPASESKMQVEESAEGQKNEDEWKDGVMPQGGKFVDVLHGLVPGVGFQVDQILGAPQIEEYRNKCQFTFGLDSKGEPSLGFRVGSFKGVGTQVEVSDGCRNVPKHMTFMCHQVIKFLRENIDEYKTYSFEDKSGFWRRFTMRSSEATGQHLGIVTIQDVGTDSEKVDKLLKDLASLLMTPTDTWPKGMAPLNGLVLQRCNAISIPNEGLTTEPIAGATEIMDELLGLKFLISPDSFFQVNTKGAEVLYSKVRELLMEGKQSTIETEKPLVFDVCCGTGTIGLTLASEASQVIGVELCKPAVVDARRNSKYNSISNARFIAARAEHVMEAVLPIRGRYADTTLGKITRAKKNIDDEEAAELDVIVDVVQELKTSGTKKEGPSAASAANANEGAEESTREESAPEDPGTKEAANDGNEVAETKNPSDVTDTHHRECLVVVDPPRAGLHKSVVKLLRNNPAVQRIVYVSCNPTGSFVTDCHLLCNTSKYTGHPFRLVRACPVDMFPHTEHIELVALLERSGPPPPPSEDSEFHSWNPRPKKRAADGEGGKKKKKRKRKVRTCKQFEQTGECKYGDKCKFDHVSSEAKESVVKSAEKE